MRGKCGPVRDFFVRWLEAWPWALVGAGACFFGVFVPAFTDGTQRLTPIFLIPAVALLAIGAWGGIRTLTRADTRRGSEDDAD